MRKQKFLGVYSMNNRDFRGSTRKRLFFVWSTGPETFEVQRLDGTYKAVGAPQEVDKRTLEALYVHEPSILAAPVSGGGVAAAERKPEPARTVGPEVEKTLRAHFRKAMQRLRRQEEKFAALEALQTLADVEEGIGPQHKYMFADFGIDLRKNKEYPLALAFCRRVLQLAPEDDHAHFNAARVLLEMGNVEAAEEHLLTALNLEPDTPVYKLMMDYLMQERRKRQAPRKKGTLASR